MTGPESLCGAEATNDGGPVWCDLREGHPPPHVDTYVGREWA